MRTTFPSPESPYGGTYADVITKISRMANYLSYGAPLARASRAQGAPLLAGSSFSTVAFDWLFVSLVTNGATFQRTETQTNKMR